MEHVLLMMTTLPVASDAQVLARQLLDQKLVACVSIFPGVQSLYRWQGAVESAVESILMIKTTADRYREVETAIVSVHPYAVPEIMAFPATTGLPEYLSWVREETRRDVDV